MGIEYEHGGYKPQPDVTPAGYLAVEHPEVMMRRLIRGIQESGFVERVVHIARGSNLRKGEDARIRLIFHDILLPAYKLMIDVKKQRIAGKFGPEPDPIPETKIEDVVAEVEELRRMNPQARLAKEARKAGGLSTEKDAG